MNIVGTDDIHDQNVATAAVLLDTQKGPIIGIFHEYAHLGKGRSIHAAGQMEWFNCVRSIQNPLLRLNTFQLQYTVARGFLSFLSSKIVPCTLSQLFNYEIMD